MTQPTNLIAGLPDITMPQRRFPIQMGVFLWAVVGAASRVSCQRRAHYLMYHLPWGTVNLLSSGLRRLPCGMI